MVGETDSNGISKADVQTARTVLKVVKEQFDGQSDEYADVRMAIAYLNEPEYYGLEIPSPE